MRRHHGSILGLLGTLALCGLIFGAAAAGAATLTVNSLDDNEIGDDGLVTDQLTLRSERAGTDPAGRFYTLSLTAEDACGNVADPAVVFTGYVPHDQNPKEECVVPQRILVDGFEAGDLSTWESTRPD